MRKFLFRCLLWLVLLFALEGLMYLTGFRFHTYNGVEVLHSIANSHKKTGKGTLILGDSVCKQLYPAERAYPDAVSLACNQAITMAGHYFLMDNYFRENEDCLPERIVFVCTPRCLQNNLDEFTYQYFLKPFLKKEYDSLFDDALQARIRQIPYHWSAALPFIRVSNFAYAYQLPPEGSYALVSPLAERYLKRMRDLAASKGIPFIILCAPLRESGRGAFESLIEQAAAQKELDEWLIQGFAGSVTYWPDSLFVDENHFEKDAVPEDPLHLL